MFSSLKINTLKRISIIPILFAFIPIVFIYMFLRDIPLLNSLFIDYINSGTSLFLPFLSSSNIVFQFSTGHLIDIIIIINIITCIERSGYQYYVKVCLQKNYLDLYSEAYCLETNGTQEESVLNSDLIFGLKEDSGTIINESSFEINLYQKSRININQFNHKSGRCSSKIKMQHNNLNYLCNSSKKKIQHKNIVSIFQKFSTNNLKNYHLPSKNNNIFSYFFENFHQEEAR